MVARQVTRAVLGAVAALFMVGVLILLHIVIYQALVPYLPPLGRSAILLGIDLLIAVVCGAMAMSNTPDAIEVEAKLLRDQSLMAMKESVAMTAVLGPMGSLAARILGRKRATGLTLAALAATFLSGNRR